MILRGAVLSPTLVAGPAAVFDCLSCCDCLRRDSVEVGPSFPKGFLLLSNALKQ